MAESKKPMIEYGIEDDVMSKNPHAKLIESEKQTSTKRMKIEKVGIGKIKPNQDNPRTIREDKFKQLVQSIKDFPEMLQLRPIIVDPSMTILGGNMRYEACKEAGLTHIYIINASTLTKEQMEEFVIKDNIQFGDWNWDDLANNWETASLVDWGMDSYHFGSSTSFLSDFKDEEDSYDHEGDMETVKADAPKITDDGYVRFEVVIKETDKKDLVDALNELRKEKGVTLGEALIQIIKEYKNARK